MPRLSFAVLLLPLLSLRVAGSCLTIYCPYGALRLLQTPNCSACYDVGAEFYVFQNRTSCSCTMKIASNCTQKEIVNGEKLAICRLPEPKALPAPQVRPEGTAVISVVVPRFFSDPDYQSLHPSNLTLVARFRSNGACQPIHSIEAERRNSDCYYRLGLAMPGIDQHTDDHYYYDDQSELESSFSRELFSGADSVLFWIEALLQKGQDLADGAAVFSYRALSPAVRFRLQAERKAVPPFTVVTPMVQSSAAPVLPPTAPTVSKTD